VSRRKLGDNDPWGVAVTAGRRARVERRWLVGIDRIGAGAVVLSALGFGTLATLTKLAYGAGVPVPTLIAWRFGIAALLVIMALPLEQWRRGRLFGRQPWTDRRRLATAAAVACFAGNTILYLIALQRVSVATAAILFYVYPLVVLALRLVGWREVPTRRQLAALLAGFSGVTLTLGWRWHTIDLTGSLLMLASASLYAAYIVFGHRGFRDASPVLATACTFSATAVVALALLSVERAPLLIDRSALLPVLGIVVLATVLPVQLFLIGTLRLGPTPAAILGTLEPVASVFVAMMVLSEQLTLVQLVGGLLVLTAAAVISGQGGKP
jgi:drug/metabolite transporter (DMT)-like permease